MNRTRSGPCVKNATVLQLNFIPAFGEVLIGLQGRSSGLWLSTNNSSLVRTACAIQNLILTSNICIPSFHCLLCINVQSWKMFEQTYCIERNRNIYRVRLQACKQQQYLKNPLFCYWSKGVLETLLWQQFLPSGRSMPLSVHRKKRRGGVFQSCCLPPPDHYSSVDLWAWAPGAEAFSEIWPTELFIGPCTENKATALSKRVLTQKTALHGTPVF